MPGEQALSAGLSAGCNGFLLSAFIVPREEPMPGVEGKSLTKSSRIDSAHGRASVSKKHAIDSEAGTGGSLG